MTDPTPRPPVGTDLAPCPDCGCDLDIREDTDGPWWDLDCPGCGWRADDVDDLAPLTLAGAPWTRALWAEVERLRAEAAELRLELAAEQGRQEGAPSSDWVWTGPGEWRNQRTGAHTWARQGWASWCLPSVESLRQGVGAPGQRAAMRAADEAEAQAAAKEPTP